MLYSGHFPNKRSSAIGWVTGFGDDVNLADGYFIRDFQGGGVQKMSRNRSYIAFQIKQNLLSKKKLGRAM